MSDDTDRGTFGTGSRTANMDDPLGCAAIDAIAEQAHHTAIDALRAAKRSYLLVVATEDGDPMVYSSFVGSLGDAITDEAALTVGAVHGLNQMHSQLQESIGDVVKEYLDAEEAA